MRRPVIMDCDPGHDDAIALLLAFSAPEALDVRAVTVSAGNQTVQKTLLNAKRVLTVAGAKPRLAKGAEHPLFRELIVAPSVHGESGLDGPELPEPDFSEEPVSAVELMRDVLQNSAEKITIVATGPLTNVAALLMCYPELKSNIELISIMGGALEGGNWSPAAEFNILVDPEAADVVFQSGVPIVMSGLDVTHKALIYPAEVEVIRGIGGKVPVLVAELIDFFSKFHLESGFAGSPIHDACAVAYLLRPDLFEAVDLHVDIETKGPATIGKTVADVMGRTGKPRNVKALVGVDREAFFKMLCDASRAYNERGGAAQ